MIVELVGLLELVGFVSRVGRVGSVRSVKSVSRVTEFLTNREWVKVPLRRPWLDSRACFGTFVEQIEHV